LFSLSTEAADVRRNVWQPRQKAFLKWKVMGSFEWSPAYLSQSNFWNISSHSMLSYKWSNWFKFCEYFSAALISYSLEKLQTDVGNSKTQVDFTKFFIR